MQSNGKAKLHLFGPFRLLLPDGQRLNISSRKGTAMLAMLATSPNGERTRAWLQDRLWGSRERLQAQNSLRGELVQLRKTLESQGIALLATAGDRVMLALDKVDIDAAAADAAPGIGQEFLEGIDIAGEDGFEEWLREQRQMFRDRARPAPIVGSEARVPAGFLQTPSIAILPFANLTGDPDKAYLAEGIGEDLIDHVSRLRWLPVISPGQSYRADGDESLLDAGRRLAAAYVLGGRLREQDNEYWLSAQIIDTTTGQVISTFRSQLLAPQAAGAMDPLVAQLAAALDNRIGAAEEVRARSRPEAELSVNDLIWRGRWHQSRLTRDDMALAGQYFDKAHELAPDYALAIIEKTQHLAYRIWNDRLPEARFHDIRRLAQRAIILDPEDARGHMLAGVAETWLRRPEPAETILKRAIGINPSLPIAYEQLATLYNLSWRGAEAIAPLQLSLRLCPNDFRVFYKHGELGLAYLIDGQFDAAADHAEQSITLRPSYWHAHVIRINALTRGGHAGRARAALADLMISRPNFVPDYIDWVPFMDRRWNDYLREGLAAVREN